MTQHLNKWVYLSYPLNCETPAYGGSDSLKIQHEKSMEKGDSCNTQYWSLSNHIGTHIDFPRHFVRAGKTSDDYDPEFWIFRSPFIIDISPIEPELIIEPEDVDMDAVPDNIDMLVIKTGFCHLREKDIYRQKNPGFAPGLAVFLRKRFIRLRVFGFDSISLSAFAHRGTGHEAHKAFLDHSNPILLLEDMDLSAIDNNIKLKQVIVSPLLVEDADGAPCTVFANIVK